MVRSVSNWMMIFKKTILALADEASYSPCFQQPSRCTRDRCLGLGPNDANSTKASQRSAWKPGTLSAYCGQQGTLLSQKKFFLQQCLKHTAMTCTLTSDLQCKARQQTFSPTPIFNFSRGEQSAPSILRQVHSILRCL